MPSVIGHIAIGLAVSRTMTMRRSMVFICIVGSICALLPDVDAFGFLRGIPYGSLFGHRGFTHSIFFSALAAFLFSFIFYRHAKPFSGDWVVLFFSFLLCGLSHGLLDAMTNGGLGVAFFSPFDERRFFLPWRPIPVAPIGIASAFQGRGVDVLYYELLHIALPVFVYIIIFSVLVFALQRKNR